MFLALTLLIGIRLNSVVNKIKSPYNARFIIYIIYHKVKFVLKCGTIISIRSILHGK